MPRKRLVGALAIGLCSVFAASTMSAGEPRQPDATIKVSSKSIAVGIGVTWGHGLLTFQGKDYPFDLSGLTVVDLGISGITAAGEVYNLTKLEDFAGKYASAEAGFTLAGGAGGIVAKNANGVVIHSRSTTEGAQLTLAPGGFTVEFEK